ncbi:hypothetical protein [Pseudomonas aeruginosa]|uniref:hypothetical protein n=1 Tax=Pseudomonas aeruginosa TaxID=287 RepID=UPI0013CE3508|nr:hypothetical protein [Pseudomonas aeruginosa]
MLIDFENTHRTYLVGSMVGNVWQFQPTNEREPRSGFFPASHQIFSNAALQVALHLYNNVNERGQCIGVSHCLYLNLTRKIDGVYKLNNDTGRVTFRLDLGAASDLFGFVTGAADEFSYRVVRSGRAPKFINGSSIWRDGTRVAVLRGEDGRKEAASIEVDLDRAAQITVAAFCIAYARLLYPSLGEAAVMAIMTPPQKTRACAEKNESSHRLANVTATASQKGDSTQDQDCAATSQTLRRLRKAIWAIGNQKWPGMTLKALQAIQASSDPGHLQELIDQGNAGDFTAWNQFVQ